ncbi:effector-associated constant component EACC1 [Micromonospora trifolii]|uniref:effector-associated constant component EACC1 n=1 Tax=Micromonospora trifolii TaxID=2911208 RepID=UPI003CEB036D
MTDSDAAARLPVRLTINPRQRQPPSVDLLTWIHRRPEYRPVVRPSGGGGRPGFSDAVIIAVLAQGLLPGLFNLLQSWVDQQRTEASIRIQSGDTEVELQVSGRTDSARLLAQATEALRAAREPGPDAAD